MTDDVIVRTNDITITPKLSGRQKSVARNNFFRPNHFDVPLVFYKAVIFRVFVGFKVVRSTDPDPSVIPPAIQRTFFGKAAIKLVLDHPMEAFADARWFEDAGLYGYDRYPPVSDKRLNSDSPMLAVVGESKTVCRAMKGTSSGKGKRKTVEHIGCRTPVLTVATIWATLL